MNDANSPEKLRQAQRAAISTAPFAPLPQNSFDGLSEAKSLLRTIRAGALATLAAATPEGGGFPFATLVNVASDSDGAPLLLLSSLAHHTRNLDADPRCSLLLAQTGKGDPLAHPRLTVAGTAFRAEAANDVRRVRERFLRRHPKSALYADFADFSFWRLEIAAAHLNGGFAKAADYPGSALLTPLDGAQDLLAAEASILSALNGERADLLRRLAAAHGGHGHGRWRAVGVDPEGLDLAAGEHCGRIVFPRLAHGADEALALLVGLAAG